MSSNLYIFLKKIYLIKNIYTTYFLTTLFALLIFTNFFIAFPVSADGYSGPSFYISSTSGSDSNDGSINYPWKSISKLNSELNGGVISFGDDIYFKRGDIFDDTYLNIRLGGSSSNEMIIGSYGIGDKPIFKDTGPYCILLNTNNVEYVTIQDLFLKKCTGTSLFAGSNLNNITIYNVDVIDAAHNGIFFDDTIGLRIDNCVVYDCGHGGIVLYGSSSHRLSNTRVLNCITYNNGDDGIQIHKEDASSADAGSYHLIRNCVSYSNGEDGFDIVAGSNIIVDGCEAYNNNHVNIVVGHDISDIIVQNCYMHGTGYGLYIGDGDNFIFRNNIVFNSGSATSYPVTIYISDDGSGWPGEDGWLKSCNIYNNNFVQPYGYSGADRIIRFAYDYFYDIYFKNNIFASLDSTNPEKFYNVVGATFPPNSEITFDNNMWYHGSDSSYNKWWNGISNMNLAQWNSYYPNDVFDNPEFVDTSNGNLNLKSTSPCIDNGAYLTQTSGSGSGSSIIVDDASYFIDGYGLIAGDRITIGSYSGLTVTNVNYNTNTITISSSISWSNHDIVSLDYSGAKPDIGAYEFIQYGNTYLEIDNFSIITSNPVDTDSSFGWINLTCDIKGNIETEKVMLNIIKPDKSIFNVSINSFAMNKYYFNTSTFFSNPGIYTYNIWVRDTNKNTYTSDSFNFFMVPNWDLNQDGKIKVIDLLLVSNKYGQSGPAGWVREDVNNDGKVNLMDLINISVHIGENWLT